jgi:DUF1680 family protein
VLNGYRGLFMTGEWAVDEVAGGLRVNTYLDGRFVAGERALAIEGDFASTGVARIRVTGTGRWSLRLRVPSWSAAPRVTVGGEPVEGVVAGDWLVLDRSWAGGDEIVLDAGARVRFVRAPGDAGAVAALRGPLVLALDGAAHSPSDRFVWLTPQEPDAEPLRETVVREGRRLAVDLPAEHRPTHYFGWAETTLPLADFASVASTAGAGGADYRVWLPQPYLDDAAGRRGPQDG